MISRSCWSQVHVVAVKWLQNTVHAYSQQTAYIWPNGSAHIDPGVATGHIITQVLLGLYAHMYAVITACSSWVAVKLKTT